LIASVVASFIQRRLATTQHRRRDRSVFLIFIFSAECIEFLLSAHHTPVLLLSVGIQFPVVIKQLKFKKKVSSFVIVQRCATAAPPSR
jgi:hypothetical protein